ncbi:magnesium chelatase subunit ChlI [Nonlabens ulvanivorans]|uniref:Magnesium chelatase subunit ChlI n=1 Tax=Nonlabens ulvanivorans TaxID=906888 RepID=A0A090QDN6_NONUL|nr:magnesium chelatase subunit ChlI [Nonlabens ulvanivorans]
MEKYQPEFPMEDRYFLKEFILWSLVEFEKLSKKRFTEGYQFNDLYSSFIKGI